jgi:Uma2 family endonuclease
MLETIKKGVNVEGYFDLEEFSEKRHEYCRGEIFAMVGGTPNHNRIVLNIAGLLNSRFGGGPCEAFASDLRVEIGKKSHYAYPDVVVVCGELEFAERRSDTITNPAVVFEVLSESTKDYDRGTKFAAYRSLKTLSDYLLVEQNKPHVEYFSKENDGSWRLRELFGMKEAIEIASVRATLSLGEIYERVAFPA